MAGEAARRCMRRRERGGWQPRVSSVAGEAARRRTRRREGGVWPPRVSSKANEFTTPTSGHTHSPTAPRTPRTPPAAPPRFFPLLREVVPFDLFPQTRHIESVAVFDRQPQPDDEPDDDGALPLPPRPAFADDASVSPPPPPWAVHAAP